MPPLSRPGSTSALTIFDWTRRSIRVVLRDHQLVVGEQVTDELRRNLRKTGNKRLIQPAFGLLASTGRAPSSRR
jgi:hypothetical protein